LERFFVPVRVALHSNIYDADFPPKTEIHKLKLKELKSKLAAQQQLMAKQRSISNNATKSSFKFINLIVKKCKPFTKGEFVKECFPEIANNILEGFKSKKDIIATIQDLQLRRHTIVRRIENLCGKINEQFLKDVSNCVAFSHQQNESTDIKDTAQLVIFIRMDFKISASKKNDLALFVEKGELPVRKYLILSILSQSIMFHYINLIPLLLMGQNQC
jgi:hypothetical protein